MAINQTASVRIVPDPSRQEWMVLGEWHGTQDVVLATGPLFRVLRWVKNNTGASYAAGKESK